MSVKKTLIYGFIGSLAILFQGCRDNNAGNMRAGFNEAKPVSARLFSINRTDSCTVISIINPWQGADNVRFNYYLVKRGMRIPSGHDSSDVIFVPVRRIICMSATHLAMVSALGEQNTIVGISGKDYIYSPAIRRRIDKDSIKDVGYDTNINKEMILELNPDLVVMYGVGSESAGYVGRLRELGIKIVFDGEYLENDPLARAEWIKVFGALYCREKMSDSIFNSETKAYNDLKSYIAGKNFRRPSVLLGLPFKDAWYISPGNSYMSKMIQDAGGSYLWSGYKSSSAVPMGIENVFVKAVSADYWLNTGTAASLNEISLVDKRFGDLKCYRDDNIYNNDRKMTQEGGNDYWEDGIIHPHVVLKDIAAILHKDLFPGYSLVYYRQVK